MYYSQCILNFNSTAVLRMWVSRLQLKSSLQYERAIEKKAIEKEFIRNGPVRLLEAVYCDPCKGKVMNNMRKCVQNIHIRLFAIILRQIGGHRMELPSSLIRVFGMMRMMGPGPINTKRRGGFIHYCLTSTPTRMEQFLFKSSMT